MTSDHLSDNDQRSSEKTDRVEKQSNSIHVKIDGANWISFAYCVSENEKNKKIHFDFWSELCYTQHVGNHSRLSGMDLQIKITYLHLQEYSLLVI